MEERRISASETRNGCKRLSHPRIFCAFLALCPCFVADTHKWFTPKVSGMVPGARDGHSACVLAKSMFIFGGYEQLVSSP